MIFSYNANRLEFCAKKIEVIYHTLMYVHYINDRNRKTISYGLQMLYFRVIIL